MFGRRKLAASLAAVLLISVLLTTTALAASGSGWTTFGYDLSNSRFQKTETTISPANAGSLTPKWAFTAGGDVSATPAIDNGSTTAYFPDWAGNLYAVDANTGARKWTTTIFSYTGIPGDISRSTPAIAGNLILVGDLGGRFGRSAWLMGINKNTGALAWKTQLDAHPAAMATGSAQVKGGIAYIGVSSAEEAYAALVPGYPCCSFRGSVVALDASTGAILWKTYTIPAKGGQSGVWYSGGSVWGSSPAYDATRNAIYVATGNNYTMPANVQSCVEAAGSDSDAARACIDPADHFDSVLALDAKTGAIKWAFSALPSDAWNLSCIGFGNPQNCPSATGPDYDFGQGPILFSTKTAKGPVDLVGAGQKSGIYWALNRDTGALVWKTEVGPGGITGGMQWGSAADGARIYVADANSTKTSWTPQGASAATTNGAWTALDPATGAILWQTPDPAPSTDAVGGQAYGAVSVANGVVYGCSLDTQGHMYAMNAATGAILWSFPSGGSCGGGAAISNGKVYWGSGYATAGGILIGGVTGNNKLFAFGLP